MKIQKCKERETTRCTHSHVAMQAADAMHVLQSTRNVDRHVEL
jgi:hypothetical protein